MHYTDHEEQVHFDCIDKRYRHLQNKVNGIKINNNTKQLYLLYLNNK
jgi:hypothetical protein